MIGIFDSGVGGLSVFREIRKILPEESYIYYADKANCPYGDKPAGFVIGRAREITEFLVKEGAQIIVVACNTATAAAIGTLRAEYSDKESQETRQRMLDLSGGRQDHIMFIGMEPAVKAAARITKSGVVGVLATSGTLHGEKYINTRDHYSNGITVVEHVGKGFVELVENGETCGEHAEQIVSASLKPLLDAGADTIVLGCTHYPFLTETIRKVASGIAPQREIEIIDPAPAVARHLLDVMNEEGLLHNLLMAATGNIPARLRRKQPEPALSVLSHPVPVKFLTVYIRELKRKSYLCAPNFKNIEADTLWETGAATKPMI